MSGAVAIHNLWTGILCFDKPFDRQSPSRRAETPLSPNQTEYDVARPRKNEVAVRDLHRALAKLGKRKPASAKEIERWIWTNHDGAGISDESIRKALLGEIDPDACNVELLFALRSFYGVDIDGLGRFAAARMRAALSLAGVGPSGPSGQGIDRSGWLRPIALSLVPTGSDG